MQNKKDTLAFDAIVFDCDGTLSAIEGIDELAELNHVGETVKELTKEAMAFSGLTLALYKQRLELTKPTQQQVKHVGQQYIDTLTRDVEILLTRLREKNIPIYVVSAGIKQAVYYLTDYLQIPRTQVFAVDVYFDAQGHYQGFDERSTLCNSLGKCAIIETIKHTHPRLALIGDGKNDLACQEYVSCFIGFGGHYYHESVAAAAQYYVEDASMLKVWDILLQQ